MIATFLFNNTYLNSGAAISGPRERQGPIGDFFDFYYSDILAGKDTYEKAESKMIEQAISLAIQKARYKYDDIELMVGGDLSNQISSSGDAIKGLYSSFIGVYGACSTAILSLIIASSFVSSNFVSSALAFSSSNYGVAERTFRYPVEYGVKKKENSTYTVTGAGAGVVSHQKSKVEIIGATLGRAIDIMWDDVNNMGSAMAYAAFDSITTHLKNTNTSLKDYDLIMTGDLSEVGSQILRDMFAEEGLKLMNYCDAGNLIFNKELQHDVFCGGSGCGCVALATYSFVIDKIARDELKNVLVVGTGCLHSKNSVLQKSTIPVIAHVINLRRAK